MSNTKEGKSTPVLCLTTFFIAYVNYIIMKKMLTPSLWLSCLLFLSFTLVNQPLSAQCGPDVTPPTIDCTTSQAGGNKFVNPSFEDNNGHNTPNFPNWSGFGPAFALNQNFLIPFTAQEGDFFAKLFGVSGLFQDIPVNPGDNISMKINVMNASFDPIRPAPSWGFNGGAFIKLEYLNSTGGIFAPVESPKLNFFTPSDVWIPLTLNATVPAGAVAVRAIVFCGQPDGGACMFDNVSFENLSEVGQPIGNVTVDNTPGACGAQVELLTPAHSDNCAVTSITNDFNGTSNASGLYPVGTTTVNWTVTDASGNTAGCSIDVTVNDAEAPQIDCASILGGANILINNSFEAGNPPHDMYGTQSWTPFGAVFTMNENNVPVDAQDGTYYLKTFGISGIFQDHAVGPGQNVAGSVWVLNASFDPMQGAPGAPGGAVLKYEFFDAGGGFLGFTETPQLGNTIPKDTWTKLSYNVVTPPNTAKIRVVVVCVMLSGGACFFDNANVSFPPSALAATAAPNCCGTQVQFPMPSVSDNCSGVNLACSPASGDFFPVGVTTVTCTATDASGNTAACSFDVDVASNGAPEKLDPQNCGNCNQIRFDFCEGADTPDLEEMLKGNAKYKAPHGFFWYKDDNGAQGIPMYGAPMVNTGSTGKKFYWVSQGIGSCEGPARRVRVRVRKTSTVMLDIPPLACAIVQLDLAAHVSDSRNFATGYKFYNTDPAVGNPNPIHTVSATKGAVNYGQTAIEPIYAGGQTYWAVAMNNTGCQVTGMDDAVPANGTSLDPIANVVATSGDLVNVAFTSPNAGYIVWNNHPAYNNPNIGIIGSAGMGNLTFTASNTGSTPLVATIKVVAYNGNCAGQERDFTITVLPGPPSRKAQNSLLFTASKLGVHDVRLDWNITYEFALERIEIEKLKNNGDWAKIGESNQLVSDYVDQDGMGNVTKYRLKLIHTDGRAIWSNEVEVNYDFFNSKRFTVYPNPSNGRFSLKVAGQLESEWNYQLTDQLGRTVKVGIIDSNDTSFDISHLPTGHYFMVITSEDGKQYLERIVKN